MSNVQLTVEQLNSTKALDVIKLDAVKERFIHIYDTLWGGQGEAVYAKESFHFLNKMRESTDLQKATPFSIFTCFIDLAVCGLSLEPGVRALCYLQNRNTFIGYGKDDRKIYETRLCLTISGYGELVLRARAGQIKYADNPVLVYEDDEFSFGDKDGHKVVNYMCHIPHKTNHIVAAFLRITRADNSVDYAVMLEEDWMRLKDYSEKNNKRFDKATKSWAGEANSLYTSNNGGIDPGFLTAKLIKHAFKTYPKVRTGKSTELESQQSDEQPIDDNDIYGMPVDQPAMPQAATPYGPPANDPAAGVKVDPAAPAAEEEDDGAF